jgi:hypothetical protein
MAGTTVCDLHGGKSPQVQRKIREQLAVLADPALGELSRLMRRGKNEAVRRAAADSILDRAGYKPSTKLEHNDGEGRPVQYRIVLVDPKPRPDDEPLQPQLTQPPATKSVN